MMVGLGWWDSSDSGNNNIVLLLLLLTMRLMIVMRSDDELCTSWLMHWNWGWNRGKKLWGTAGVVAAAAVVEHIQMGGNRGRRRV